MPLPPWRRARFSVIGEYRRRARAYDSSALWSGDSVTDEFDGRAGPREVCSLSKSQRRRICDTQGRPPQGRRAVSARTGTKQAFLVSGRLSLHSGDPSYPLLLTTAYYRSNWPRFRRRLPPYNKIKISLRKSRRGADHAMSILKRRSPRAALEGLIREISRSSRYRPRLPRRWRSPAARSRRTRPLRDIGSWRAPARPPLPCVASAPLERATRKVRAAGRGQEGREELGVEQGGCTAETPRRGASNDVWLHAPPLCAESANLGGTTDSVIAGIDDAKHRRSETTGKPGGREEAPQGVTLCVAIQATFNHTVIRSPTQTGAISWGSAGRRLRRAQDHTLRSGSRPKRARRAQARHGRVEVNVRAPAPAASRQSSRCSPA